MQAGLLSWSAPKPVAGDSTVARHTTAVLTNLVRVPELTADTPSRHFPSQRSAPRNEHPHRVRSVIPAPVAGPNLQSELIVPAQHGLCNCRCTTGRPSHSQSRDTPVSLVRRRPYLARVGLRTPKSIEPNLLRSDDTEAVAVIHQACLHLAVHVHPDRTREMGATGMGAAIGCPLVGDSTRGTETAEPLTSTPEQWSPASRCF